LFNAKFVEEAIRSRENVGFRAVFAGVHAEEGKSFDQGEFPIVEFEDKPVIFFEVENAKRTGGSKGDSIAFEFEDLGLVKVERFLTLDFAGKMMGERLE